VVVGHVDLVVVDHVDLVVVDHVDPLDHSDRMDHDRVDHDDRIPMGQIPKGQIPKDPYHAFSFSLTSFYQMVDDHVVHDEDRVDLVDLVDLVVVGHVVVDHNEDPLDHRNLKH